MINSLSTSLTGLNAFSEKLSVISDNVSNAETTSYKSNSVSFADLLNQSLTDVAGCSAGAGVEIQDVSASWTQGSISSTGNTTDLAINGSGFFIVVEPGDSGATYYTRDGSFEFDKDGTLVNSSAMAVQGYAIDEDGNLGALGDIVISYEASSPKATSEISATLNLNAELEDGDTFSNTITVYDSLGNEIPITITYTKSSTSNEWNWEADIPDAYGAISGSGTLTFDSAGALVSGTDPELTLTLTNGAETTQTISWDIYDESGETNGSLTQYASECAVNTQSQDGYASGELYSVYITEEGIIVGAYTNGETKELYQLALADFINYDGLNNVGNNLYQATSESGQAIVGVPGSGQLGSLATESLEMSNVDLANELANMITAQRAYQACARVFTTTSDIIETTVNLK